MADRFGYADPDHPFTLLPVGLQCRFGTADGERPGQGELRVRVLPDPIHGRAFTEELTRFEVQTGRAYWTRLWSLKGGTADEVTLARKWLAQRVGAYRAVHVAAETQPTNWKTWHDQPEFPTPPEIEAAPPVMVELLPDFWVWRLYDKSMRLLMEGRAPHRIDQRLAMAPSLEALEEGDEDAPDEIMKFLRAQRLDWMANFELAVRKGMAFRIPYGDRMPNFGALIVAGVKGDDPIAAAEALDAQFRAHGLTHGFDLVPQGTPTNNSDLGRSGFAENPTEIDTLFAAEDQTRPEEALIRAALLKKEPGLMLKMPAADAASLAFGMTFGNRLDKTTNAELLEGLGGSVMNTLIGPGLANYFTDKVFTHKGGFGPLKQHYGKLDAHHLTWVRGAGPLPTIRVGPQPYGILPTVASLKPFAERDPILFETIRALFPEWKSALPLATLDPDATDGRPVSDASQSVEVLSEVLGAVPHPTNLHLREFLNHGEEDAERLNELVDAFRALLAEIEERAPLLDPTAPSPQLTALSDRMTSIIETQPTIDGQVDEAAALAADIDSLAGPILSTYPDALQEKLDPIRDLLALYQEATDALPAPFADLAERGPLTPAAHTREKDRLLHFVASVYGAGLIPVGQIIGDREALLELIGKAGDALEKPGAPEDRDRLFDDEAPLLHHMIDQSWLHVEERKAPVLSLALGAVQRRIETIGIDGWSELSAELELRFRESLGLFMNRLDAWHTSFAARELAERRVKHERGTTLGGYGWLLDIRPSNEAVTDGFIHASSMNHAKTAALLRSGWKGYGTATSDHPLSVDLTSTRVRTAHWILDGVRNGQDLAQILGARFERSLRDARPRLDLFIDEVRGIVNAGKDTPTPKSVIADGWLIARAYAENPAPEDAEARLALDALFGPGSSVGNARRRSAARRLCRKLAQELDGVADLLMAQSVHSLAQGNMAETASVLNFGGDTQGAVPQINVTSTERQARQITHRIVALLPEVPPTATNAITAAEPGTHSLLRDRLPDPAGVEARYRLMRDGRQIAAGYVALSDTGLDAVEAMCLTGRADTQADAPIGRAMRALIDVPLEDGDTLDLHPDRARRNRISLDDFGIIASAGQDAFQGLRAMTAADLASPEATDTPTDQRDEGDLDTRIDRAVEALTALRDALQDGSDVRTTALRLAALHVPGALALAEAPEDDASAVVDAVEARLAILDDPDLDQTDRLAQVIGRQLPVVPILTGLGGGEITASRDRLDAQTAHAADIWWRQVRHVNRHADEVGAFLDLTFDASRPPIRSAQLPELGEDWLATARPGDPLGGRLVLSAVTNGDRLGGDRAAGLVVDSWTEDVPNQTQQTGVAFHYDSPTSRAPQCILMPLLVGVEKTIEDEVFANLESVIAQMKLRGVGPDRQVSTGHILPMTYLPGHAKTPEVET